jgi:histone acetyltransferase (RNA polymerase elongator complex component)
MEEAERIAREEHGSGRIAVISGKLSCTPFETASS